MLKGLFSLLFMTRMAETSKQKTIIKAKISRSLINVKALTLFFSSSVGRFNFIIWAGPNINTKASRLPCRN